MKAMKFQIKIKVKGIQFLNVCQHRLLQSELEVMLQISVHVWNPVGVRQQSAIATDGTAPEIKYWFDLGHLI